MKTIIFTICEQIKNISILLRPIIPISANKVLKTLNIKDENKSLDQINNLNSFNHDIELKELDILFTKIENDNWFSLPFDIRTNVKFLKRNY